MWVSTVRSDKNSRSAICRLVRSSAMSRAISSCLGVSAVSGADFNGRRRLGSGLVLHGEGDTFVDRHRAAPGVRGVKRLLADPPDDDRHRPFVLLAVQLDQGQRTRVAHPLRGAEEDGGTFMAASLGGHRGQGLEHHRQAVAVVNRVLAHRCLAGQRFGLVPVAAEPVGLGQEVQLVAPAPGLAAFFAQRHGRARRARWPGRFHRLRSRSWHRVLCAISSTWSRRISRASESANSTCSCAPARSPCMKTGHGDTIKAQPTTSTSLAAVPMRRLSSLSAAQAS